MAVANQFQHVGLRIGNTDKTGSPKEQFSENRLVGQSGPASSTRAHTYEVVPVAEGRYATLQCVVSRFLATEEIVVYKLL